jgi:Protein of unknown function (DUF2752)
LNFWARVSLLVFAAGFALPLGIAIALDPYKDGRVWFEETHRQMGLPPCTFKQLTGMPCPSCGMTSSFALTVRGDLWNAAQANWVGMVLALFCIAYIPWAIWSAYQGRLVGIRNFETVLVRGVVGFLILLFARWAIVLAMNYWEL